MYFKEVIMHVMALGDFMINFRVKLPRYYLASA